MMNPVCDSDPTCPGHVGSTQGCQNTFGIDLLEGMTFAEKLEKVKLLLSYTQTDLRKGLRISERTVSRWLSGKNLPKPGQGPRGRDTYRKILLEILKQHHRTGSDLKSCANLARWVMTQDNEREQGGEERGSPPPPENEEALKTSPAPTEKAQESSLVVFSPPQWKPSDEDPLSARKRFDAFEDDARRFLADAEKRLHKLQMMVQREQFELEFETVDDIPEDVLELAELTYFERADELTAGVEYQLSLLKSDVEGYQEEFRAIGQEVCNGLHSRLMANGAARELNGIDSRFRALRLQFDRSASNLADLSIKISSTHKAVMSHPDERLEAAIEWMREAGPSLECDPDCDEPSGEDNS